jgi:hypothetical protein
MAIILITVVTQGVRVPTESRGKFSTPLLTINNGIFQAIGVISFGSFVTSALHVPTNIFKHSSATITPYSSMAPSKPPP